MKNKLMTIAVLLTVMMAMTGIAAAVDEETDPVRFLGQITDENGIGIPNIPVQITKEFIIMGIHFTVKWEDTTDANGNYETPYNAYFLEFLRSGHYKLFLNGNLAGEKDLVNADFTFDKKEWIIPYYHYEWDVQVPEFSTIAIPIVSVIGMLFVFQKRKKTT